LKYDIAIIGAGVSGASIARELSKYKLIKDRLKIILLEKDASPCMGTTKANSGIIHGGYAAKHGTNKARFNIESRPLFEEICKELKVSYGKIGSFVVSISKEKNDALYELKDNGLKNGISDLEVIENRDKILKMEPNLNPEVTGILFCKGAAIISPYELNIGLVENAIMNGVEFSPNSQVVDIKKNSEFKIILQANKEIKSDIIINAAGLYADKISAMLGLDYFKF
jgi:glycerol-3-phosphate dehydrogenase